MCWSKLKTRCWLVQPIWKKYWSKWIISPMIGVKNEENYWKSQPWKMGWRIEYGLVWDWKTKSNCASTKVCSIGQTWIIFDEARSEATVWNIRLAILAMLIMQGWSAKALSPSANRTYCNSSMNHISDQNVSQKTISQMLVSAWTCTFILHAKIGQEPQKITCF